MEWPGVTATPEELERWMDATVDRRINCAKIQSRWLRIPTPSTRGGISLYECQNCGRLSNGAEKTCYPLVGDKGKWR